ncbi:MAG: citryl-CoA lyase [Candidatus Zixiibacteriota bacterium]
MADNKWKTAITDATRENIRVRGYSVTAMMEKLSFAEAVFLVLRGELPSKAEAVMMNAILVATVDHGPTPPSVLAARTSMSGGNPLNAAIAAGVLAIGDTHGGAIEQAARILQEWAQKGLESIEAANQLVSWLEENKKRMPGFGHQLHERDPRTTKLFELATTQGVKGNHVELCLAVEKVLAERTGRALPININGAVAAVISDMGFDWRLGKGLFVISRVPGLVAHAYEEMTREKPMRKLGPTPFEYDGPKERDI